MPPKGARGAARGRGRGRGKALAPPAEEQPPTSQLSAQDDLASQSTIAPSSPIEPPAPKNTTPHNELFDDADPSPNSSPATVPTETPAPTPIRPSALRPESSSSASDTRGRGGARGGRVATAASRFKPKNIRRNAAELEELAKKEQSRLAGIAAEAAREEFRAQRGRGKMMRGRGDVMGRGAGLGRPAATASGVFGVVPEGLQKKPEFLAPRASGAGGSSGSGASRLSGPKTVKKEGGTISRGDYTSSGGTGGTGGTGSARSKDWHPDPQYPDEDLEAPRVDIELINLISDSDDDLIFSGSRPRSNGKAKSSSKGGLKPVRLHREEHKERVTLVNTEPTTKVEPESDEELPTIDELRSSRAAPKDKEFKGVYQDLEEEVARIKTEPDLELSFHEAPPPPESSPNSNRKVKERTSSPQSRRKTKEQASAIDLDPDDGAVAKGKKDKKARRFSKKYDKEPVIQTAEDRAEYERHLEDVAILANELGGLQGNFSNAPRDAEGDIAMEGGISDSPDKKEGRLYLFQFPPVLPELYNPINDKPKTKAEIKTEKEKEKAEKDKDVQMTGASTKGKAKMKEKIDLTGDPTVIKVEEILGPDGKPRREEEKKKRGEVVHEEGWIGKLIVRESGRVELCWGGTNLLVGRGVDAGFLTTGVMVDMIEKGPPGGGVPEGKALSMGQVMGKFVVTPDWEKM